MSATFERAPENAALRNGSLWIRAQAADTLADVGLIANAKLNFKPINQDGNSGSNTIGFDPTITVDCQQTAVTDVAAVLGLPQKILKQVIIVADDERFYLADFMLNPEGSLDMSGGESKFTLTGHKKMSTTQAKRIHFKKLDAADQPAVPVSDAAYTNAFTQDCLVEVSGGTVTAIDVNGTVTGQTSGTFLVLAGQTITLTYTVAPAWVWFGN
jgi:hypothetical protein